MAAISLRAGILSILALAPLIWARVPPSSHRQPVEWGVAIQRWLVLDPLKAPPDGMSALDREILPGEATLSPAPGHPVSGMGMRFDPVTGRDNFPHWRTWLGPRPVAKDEIGFWYAELIAPKEGRAKLVTGMSGGYQAWWNGFPVAWSRDTGGAGLATMDVVLRPGINRILIKGDRFGGGSPLVQLAPPGATHGMTVAWSLPADPDAETPDLRVEWLDSGGKTVAAAETATLPFPLEGLHPRWQLRGWHLRHHLPAGATSARWTLSRGDAVVAVKNTPWPCGSPLLLGPECAVPWEVELSDQESGAPVSGAVFHDRFTRRADVPGPGRYRLMEWDVVNGTVECRAAGHLESTLVPEPGGKPALALRATALRLAGLVTGADGAPLAGARVQEKVSWSTLGREWNEPALTDSAGRFDVSPPSLGFSPQPVELRISADGFVPAQIAIVPGKPRETPVKLERGRELSGRFILAGSGKPCPEVVVMVTRNGERLDGFATDADGRFVTWLAEMDGVSLEVDPLGAAEPATFAIPATGGAGHEWILAPVPAATVLDPDGEPVAGAVIHTRSGQAVTGPDGRAGATGPHYRVDPPGDRFKPAQGEWKPGQPREVRLEWSADFPEPAAPEPSLAWWLAPDFDESLSPGERRRRADELLAAWVPPVEVKACIAALSSEDFAKREEATRQLAALGKSVHRELEATRATADPETVQRINAILSASPVPATGWPALDPRLGVKLLRRAGGDLVRLLGDDFAPWCEARVDRLGQARLEGPVPDANPLTAIFRELDRRGRGDLLEQVISSGGDPAACQAADAVALSGDWDRLSKWLGKLPAEQLASRPGLQAKAKALIP